MLWPTHRVVDVNGSDGTLILWSPDMVGQVELDRGQP
jgi:hypothetical protein